MAAAIDASEKSKRERELARARNRRYRAAHPDRIKDYRVKHAEETKAYLKNYYRANKVTLSAKSKLWRQQNAESKLATDRAWRQRNQSKMRQYREKWKRNNPEKAAACKEATRKKTLPAQRARLKKWISQNYAKHRAYHKNYAKTHRSLFAKHERKRRALKLAASINLKGIELFIASVKSKPYVPCYYCGAKTPTTVIHFDHIVALSAGGSHSVDNLCASCPACNLEKGKKRIDAWVRIGQQIFNL